MTLRSPYRPTGPMTRGVVALAAFVVLAAAAGCGGDGSPRAAGSSSSAGSGSPTPTPTASATSPSGTPTTPAPTGTPSRSVQPPHTLPPVPSSPVRTSPRPSGTTIVVDGVARAGVEAGCTVLSGTDGRTWLLLNANGGTPDQKKIPLGVPIRVHGVQVDQIVSYCQQGTPLEVTDVTTR